MELSGLSDCDSMSDEMFESLLEGGEKKGSAGESE